MSMASHVLTSMEHSLSDETVPQALVHVGPSPSADDAIWAEVTKHSQRHFETLQERATRHRVDREAAMQMGEARKDNLSFKYGQGRHNPVLEGEAPIDSLDLKVVDTNQAFDHDASFGAGHVVLNQTTAMDRRTVPDDGQFSRYMPLEVPEELDDLGSLDAAGVDLEVESVQGQATDH